VYSSNINNLKDHEAIKEMFYAPMNIKTMLTTSILFVAGLIALLFAPGPLHENHQVFAANNAKTGNVGHLYQGGIPGYPYFGGYPNYGGYPYITGYGYPYDGDHSYNHGYGGYTFFQHHHHHHHHTH